MPRRSGFLPVLMLLMLTLAIAACGGTPPASQPEPTAEPTVMEATTPETSATAETNAAEATAPASVPTDSTDAIAVPDLGGRSLVIGSDTTYPPMEYVDNDRKIVGFDVDMMNAVAELINAEIEFVTFPNFDAIFAALANGEFDVVVSSVSVTEERRNIIDFSDPYLNIGQVIAVSADNETITSADNLTSAELVGVQGGTTGEQAALEAGVSEDQIKRYDTIDLAFQDLANGAIDAVIADGPPTAEYTAQIEGIKAVGEPFTTEDYAIALQQGDEELLLAINAALQQMKDDGTLQSLMEKWNLQDVATIP